MNYPDLRGTHLEARELPGEKVEALQTHLRVLSSLEVNITLGAADEILCTEFQSSLLFLSSQNLIIWGKRII